MRPFAAAPLAAYADALGAPASTRVRRGAVQQAEGTPSQPVVIVTLVPTSISTTLSSAPVGT